MRLLPRSNPQGKKLEIQTQLDNMFCNFGVFCKVTKNQDYRDILFEDVETYSYGHARNQFRNVKYFTSVSTFRMLEMHPGARDSAERHPRENCLEISYNY